MVYAIAITCWTTALAAHSRHSTTAPSITFVARNILGDADEGHWKYYPTFSEPAPFCLAQRIGEDNWKASAFIAR
jgi:hypothetical protein